jgi:hypothetical protein
MQATPLHGLYLKMPLTARVRAYGAPSKQYVIYPHSHTLLHYILRWDGGTMYGQTSKETAHKTVASARKALEDIKQEIVPYQKCTV